MKQNKILLFVLAFLVIIAVGLAALFFLLKGVEPNSDNLSQNKEQAGVLDSKKEQPVKPAYDAKLLQGKWKSVDDPNSVIEFNGDKKIEYYSGKKLSDGTFVLAGGHLTIDGKMEIFKYKVAALSADVLTLLYLPEGNELKYSRVK